LDFIDRLESTNQFIPLLTTLLLMELANFLSQNVGFHLMMCKPFVKH